MADRYGQYLVIRFMPSKLREECVNIGMLVFDKEQTQFWIQWTDQIDRATALYPQFNRMFPDIRDMLEHDLKRFPVDIVINRYCEPKSNWMIQLTRPRAVVLKDDTMSSLMRDFVEYKNV